MNGRSSFFTPWFCFALSLALHAGVLLAIGYKYRGMLENETVPPELDVTSVSLTLGDDAPETPSFAASVPVPPQAQPPPPEAPAEPPLPDSKPVQMTAAEPLPPEITPPDLPPEPEAVSLPKPEPPKPQPKPPEPKPDPPKPIPAPPPPAPKVPETEVKQVTAPVLAPSNLKPDSSKAADALPAPATAASTPSGGSAGRVDAAPQPIRMIKPIYPVGSRKRGEEGSVTVRLEITERGTVSEATIVKSSGFAELDSAARKTCLQARFKPGKLHNRPVQSSASITLDFVLKDN